MKRRMLAAAVVAAGLVPSTADAAIPQVFTKTTTPVNCTVQASGQRFCGTSTAQILSWDGIPLDVIVRVPARADGRQRRRPVPGDRHLPRLGRHEARPSTGADVQRASPAATPCSR